MNQMKIVVGMGSIDDYIPYVEAGADEIFVGYVPHWYREKYGAEALLNRREVMNYNVQIGSESELLILREMIKKYRVPVTIAFNGLIFSDEQREDAIKIMRDCQKIGYSEFILAEAELIRQIESKDDFRIHISGECTEWNWETLKALGSESVTRIIFPRQTTIDEMQALTDGKYTYEAFFLNERCEFTGAYCNSFHCDEMCHLCKVPYRLGKMVDSISEQDAEGAAYVTDGRKEGLAEETSFAQKGEPITESEGDENSQEDLYGATGCGACALWRLREAGITHLKIVSRGNQTESTLRDIRETKRLLDKMVLCDNEDEYVAVTKDLRENCSGNCYYKRV